MSRILVIDDEQIVTDGLVLHLSSAGHEAVGAYSGPEGLERLAQQPFDLVITDYWMKPLDGFAVLEQVSQRYPDVVVMMLTAHASVDIDVKAKVRGAFDFIEKGEGLGERVLARVERALLFRQVRQEYERLKDENRYLREEIGGRYNFGEIVGSSTQMREVLAAVHKVAGTDSSVLIYGESGTGKELVARAIHYHSPRREGPFVKVNCGSLPRDLVESELFGHERGAFTGAVRQKKGKFELADGGTIFLDEVGDVPLETQAKLLRVLQEKEFDRVGGEHTLWANVRVVAATNRPLREMVDHGDFREDLYYRLDVIPIGLPPLRERKDDIPQLVEHFLRKKCGEMNVAPKRLTDEAMAALVKYPWPGNVRELENVIERTVVLADSPVVGPQDVPLTFEAGSSRSAEGVADGDVPLNQALEDLERRMIIDALQKANQVKTRTAELLGIKTSALYYKLDKYGLE